MHTFFYFIFFALYYYYCFNLLSIKYIYYFINSQQTKDVSMMVLESVYRCIKRYGPGDAIFLIVSRFDIQHTLEGRVVICYNTLGSRSLIHIEKFAQPPKLARLLRKELIRDECNHHLFMTCFIKRLQCV